MRRKKIGYIFPLPLAFATEIKKWNLSLWYTLIILRFPKDKNDDRKILWKEVEISEAWNCCHLGILRDIHTNTLVVHRYKNHWCQIIELSGIFVDCSHTLLFEEVSSQIKNILWEFLVTFSFNEYLERKSALWWYPSSNYVCHGTFHVGDISLTSHSLLYTKKLWMYSC